MLRRWWKRLWTAHLDTVKVWREAPDGEYGAWQYSYDNSQGGASCLKDALYQASFFKKPIEVVEHGKGVSEVLRRE